jgi:tetratricopeptide (TPR) repeat protein
LEPPSIPGYEIIGELGRGGMGVVYRARQTALNRVVALKVILAGPYVDPCLLARFRTEAEAAARLQHPNIVQIFEVGDHADRPYLTREYVDGGSLDRVLAGTPLPARAAAELVETLGRAIDFAHRQGVVHRDLKPANVLLAGNPKSEIRNPKPIPNTQEETTNPKGPAFSDFGFRISDFAPKVTDFGLAKLLDDPAGPTQTGAILGTPSYMAPEQAAGKVGEVGPAADIYALGAILYEALTGRPPFKAATVLSTLEQVRSLEPVPPGRLQPHLPHDLQTICLKCLEKEARRRYATGAELAADLRRFLNGEPISARPVGRLEKAAKWARRNPAKAALAAVSGLAVILLAAGVVWLRAEVERAEAGEQKASQERERAETNERRAARQRSRADANYRAARGALQKMLERLNDQGVAGVPRLREMRRGMLEDALTFYQGVLKQSDGRDAAVRFDVAVAYHQTGAIQMDLGRPALGEKNLEHARELLEKLVAHEPGVDDYRGELAECYHRLGFLIWTKPSGSDPGMLRRAQGYLERSVRLRAQLVRAHPGGFRWQFDLARAYHELAHLYKTAQPARAESHYHKARVIFERLVHEYPKSQQGALGLAKTYTALGGFLASRGPLRATEVYYRKAETLLKPLVRDHPELDCDYALTALYSNWGNDLRGVGQTGAALGRLALAIQTAEPRLRREPDLPWMRQVLRNAYGSRAQVLGDLRRHTEALKDWDRAVALTPAPERYKVQCLRALALIQSGQYGRALAEARSLTTDKDAPPDVLYHAACLYARFAQAVDRDHRLGSAERMAKAENYAVQAVALLDRLRAAGYFKMAAQAERLAKDGDLESLHGRQDFQRLVRQVFPHKP